MNSEVLISDALVGLDYLKRRRVRFQTIFADPPYNIGVDYGGKVKDRRSWSQYNSWSVQWFEKCVDLLAPEGSIFVMQYPEICADWKPEFERFAKLNQWITWTYNTNIGHSPKRFTRAHRSILWFSHKESEPYFDAGYIKEPYKNPSDRRVRSLLADGSSGRTPYDWWEFQLVKNVSQEKELYRNQIPQKIVDRCILATSRPRQRVLDPFLGTGTTLAGAYSLGRRGLGIDINARLAKIWRERIPDLAINYVPSRAPVAQGSTARALDAGKRR